MKKIYVLILVTMMSGCSLFPQEHAEIKDVNDDVSVITYPTALRGTYIFKKDSYSFCAEPSPDIAFDSIKKLTSDISGTTAHGETAKITLNADVSEKVINLAGRTELVVLARDLLYRACEANKKGDSKLTETLYTQVIDLVKNLGEAERINAETDYIKATEFKRDSSSECIQKWLSQDSKNADVITKWLNGKTKLWILLNGDFKSDREQAIIDLKIKCS